MERVNGNIICTSIAETVEWSETYKPCKIQQTIITYVAHHSKINLNSCTFNPALSVYGDNPDR